MKRKLLTIVTLGILVIAIATPLPTSHSAAEGDQFPISWLVILANPRVSSLHVPPPPILDRPGTQGSQIVVNFMENEQNVFGEDCASWPQDARNAFSYAVGIWSAMIDSSVSIVVNACWTNLGYGVLGSCGPYNVRNFENAPQSDTWYPMPLANALAGQDLNGSKAEIEGSFNSGFSNWYFGTDGNTPGGQYDFVTVVLHELTHGLGFVGSMQVENGKGSWGWGSEPASPAIFDRFLVNGAGQGLVTAFPNNSAELANQLTGGGGGVFFNGQYARAALWGEAPQLYAPSTWSGGSSIYHLDEKYNNTSNAIMTYSLDSGESIHDPGSAVRGMFRDMGWTISTLNNLSVVNRAVDEDKVKPGSPITFTLTIINSASVTATNAILIDRVPSQVLSPSWQAHPSLGGISVSGTFTWSLPDLPPNYSGVITVYGTLDPSLPDLFMVVNEAVIGPPGDDLTPYDNTSIAVVGGVKTFLPLVAKGNK